MEPTSRPLRLGYDPWLHTSRGAEKLATPARRPARRWSRRRNPVDALWHDRPRPALGPVTLRTLSSPAKAQPKQAHANPCRNHQLRPTRWWSPIRRRWRGPSTFVAVTSPTRRCRSVSRSFRAKAVRRSISTAASSERRAGGLEDFADLREPAALRHTNSPRSSGKTVRPRPRTVARWPERPDRRGGRQGRRAARPDRPIKAVRTPSRSKARAPRTGATAPPWHASSPGSTGRPPAAS